MVAHKQLSLSPVSMDILKHSPFITMILLSVYDIFNSYTLFSSIF